MKNCSRCKNEIICQSNNIAECACNSIIIKKETREFLSKRSKFECLCNDCLLHLDTLIERASNLDNQNLKEGVHYYIENEKLVFSELYHTIRGYCCKSGCRHCVYGFKM